MTDKNSNINTDPLTKDSTKGKRGRKQKEPTPQEKYNSVHPMNDWIVEVIERSDKEYIDKIVSYHDITVNTLLKLTGQYLTEYSEEYRNVFSYQISQGNFILTEDDEVVKVTPKEPEVVSQTVQQSEQTEQQFWVKNPLENLRFGMEEKQYRRIRKKINFVDSKIILDTVLAIPESKKEDTFVKMYVRKSMSSNPEKDKVVLLTDLIHHVVVTLNEYSQPRTYENRSFYLDKFYAGLIDDIADSADGSLYDKKKLVEYIISVRDEVKGEIDALYEKIYRKVGLKVTKPLTSKKKPSLNLRNEPDEINSLYSSRDLDLMNLINKLDYYEMVNIVD